MRARAFRPRPALEFEGAAARPGAPPLDLRVDEGEIVWIRCGAPPAAAELLDLASGLLAPAVGVARTLGLDWGALGPRQAAALRGRIGRLLPATAWTPHISVAENVALRPLHHTDRRESELIEETAAFCRRFGLPGAPLGRPAEAGRDALHRAALARVFVDSPSIVLLDETAEPIRPDLVEATANAALEAARRGAAVLWLTEPDHRDGPALMEDARPFRLGPEGLGETPREAAP